MTGGVCSAHGRHEKCMQNFVVNPEGNKRHEKAKMQRCRLNSTSSEMGPVAGTCEHGKISSLRTENLSRLATVTFSEIHKLV